MSDALLGTLAEALAELVAAVETSGDEVLDPDTATTWLESTAHTLSVLPPADRRTLDGLVRQAALRRPEGPRRDALLRVPDQFDATTVVVRQAPAAVVVPAVSLAGPAAARAATSDAAPAATATAHPGTPGAHAAAATAHPATAIAHAAACDAVAAHVRRFAALVRDADPATPVPTCPGWTLADLTRHVGALHRWTERLVRTRATVRVHVKDVPLDLPADPAGYAGWLTEGAEQVLATLRATDPDLPVWSPGADPHARSYPRRLLNEAVVHLADAEIALGGAPTPVDPATAADAIDQFLADAPYLPWVAEPVAHLDREGAVLRLAARDTGAVRTLTLGGGGFTWTRGSGPSTPTAVVEADAGELLLLLHRRYAADDPRFTLTGDRDLLDDWLAATAL
ncbi:maleylpyruvate isomerase family mycothiol-dependent enzyme [Streptomyces sp. NPDC059534]|uniref:maleylpyruvate isomerase family mycothiol-dependent enzyme n=1 Tax=Streptomyces sp. NPDC059534 TaxID=3346859 RepID=UPI003677FBBE